MKFQNPSMHHSKVSKKCNRRTYIQTHRQTSQKSNMPFQLFQSWGHRNGGNVATDIKIIRKIIKYTNFSIFIVKMNLDCCKISPLTMY